MCLYLSCPAVSHSCSATWLLSTAIVVQVVLSQAQLLAGVVQLARQLVVLVLQLHVLHLGHVLLAVELPALKLQLATETRTAEFPEVISEVRKCVNCFSESSHPFLFVNELLELRLLTAQLQLQVLTARQKALVVLKCRDERGRRGERRGMKKTQMYSD
ncbi:hypothetical protein EYF80_061473 [Liparis tanakae]|uniref:Uncharacterized protein n=1 Tax=Liparis tanakae TaxID=230148 RepID=A0A4Z2EI12_9TELE|nr:hypothetical protein EYF80_061473 [Liparis tanakae]